MKVANSSKVDRQGVQLVGYKFEKLGYAFREQTVSDFGIDAHIELIENGNATGELIAVQIKSGASWFKEVNNQSIVYRGDIEHLNYWLKHSLPVLIVVCDIENDECYWQVITPNHVIYTKAAWKIEIPLSQKVNIGMYVDLQRLVRKLPVHKDYTISSIDENSHGLAKRYSLRVILNRELTQAEIINVIKVCTLEAINCEYHRSEITRSKWSGTPAHVVWLRIYPTSEDEKNNNSICGTEWFSEALDSEHAPISNGGEDIGLNIKVVWEDDYLSHSAWNAEHSVSKEYFILRTTNIAEDIKQIMETLNSNIGEYCSDSMDFHDFLSATISHYPRIDALYNSGTNIGLSPYECKEVSIKFQSLIAHAHNVFQYPYTFVVRKEDLDEKNIICNMNNQLGFYIEAVHGFHFELKKVQR